MVINTVYLTYKILRHYLSFEVINTGISHPHYFNGGNSKFSFSWIPDGVFAIIYPLLNILQNMENFNCFQRIPLIY